MIYTSQSPLHVAVVTSTRADYGLFYWTLKALQRDERCQLSLIVSGSHLSRAHGYTLQEIESDGIAVSHKVDFLAEKNATDEQDSPLAMAQAMARATEGFARVLDDTKPSVLLLLGDRFEILAAAQAALLLNIPIAHIHGGEITEGAVDDALRHAISKMATLHFTTSEQHTKRVIQLGEAPERVLNVGAPGLETLLRENPMPLQDIESSLGVRFTRPLMLITYHPETQGGAKSHQDIIELLEALSGFEDMFFVFTAPNIDAGGEALAEAIQGFVDEHAERSVFVESLGRQRYLSMLHYVDLVVGNSSSGIIEVPSFAKPSVNIGDRQKGRECAESVIHVATDKAAISEGIHRALSADFRKKTATGINPYGQGRSSEAIVQGLLAYNWERGPALGFYDLNDVTGECSG